MPTEDLIIRPATDEDLPAVADVFLAARAAAVPSMPPVVRTPEQIGAQLSALSLGDRDLWVADHESGVVGYAERKDDWLDDLYVLPSHQGRGIGSALLELVKVGAAEGFSLWVFESNHPARAFYRRHGLIELETTDGSGNEEGAPDVRMVWPGPDPVAFLRRCMDAADATLAELLARRCALTAAIQSYKTTPGRPGRDPEREAEIVRRMARHAPSLDPAHIGAVMEVVIGQALAAYEKRSGSEKPGGTGPH